MSATPKRLDLRLDIGDLTAQQALVRTELTPPELVVAVLAEFHELEYLGNQAEAYCLRRQNDGEPLDEQRPLGTQLNSGDRLVLTERLAPVPDGATRPAAVLYLRERASGRVYRLSWLPALIGRPDQNLTDNELLAIDLADHAAGTRVSRRHAQIIARDGQYLVERLAPNPTMLIDQAGRTITLEEEPLPIQHGDTLLLERSQIALSFIVRNNPYDKE